MFVESWRKYMAPGDSFFAPGVRVSGLTYQLGLDRHPEEETRNPRVLHGDPSLCQRLEETNRLSNRSTNFSINWSEWIPDLEAAAVGRQYVVEVLLVGVPPGRYAYTLIAHDEKIPDGRDESLAKNRKRTSVHGKIINTRFPGGGYLQPIYPPRERLLTTLYFAHLAIERNWSHPLDPERARNVASHHVHGPVTTFRRAVVEQAELASRPNSGEPGVLALMAGLQELGISDVYATRGLFGKPGIDVQLGDHPNRIRFSGPKFEPLHDYIQTHDKPKNEHQGHTERSPGEEYFPGGYLNRSPEHAARILYGLKQHLAYRAQYNRQRYRIDAPTLVIGGGDFHVSAGMGVRHGVVGGHPQTAAVGHDQRSVCRVGFAPRNFNPQEVTPGANDEEPAKLEKPASNERNTHLRGVRAHLGALVAGVVADAASGVRAVHESVQRAHESITRSVQETERRAAGISAAARRLDDAGFQLGSAARGLERTLECPTPRLGLTADFLASVGDEGMEVEEYLIRARRPRLPLPEPLILPQIQRGGP